MQSAGPITAARFPNQQRGERGNGGDSDVTAEEMGQRHGPRAPHSNGNRTRPTRAAPHAEASMLGVIHCRKMAMRKGRVALSHQWSDPPNNTDESL